MRRFEVSLIVTIVAGLACGPAGLPSQDSGSETSSGAESAGDGDGDGDAAGDGDGEPNSCALDLDAEIAVMLVDLQTIVDGAIAYFEEEHVLSSCDEPDCEPIDFPLHHCPHPDGQAVAGVCGMTPSLERDCNEGPDCKCAPVSNGGGPGQYDPALWHDMWQKLGFSKDSPHAFHYNFGFHNETSGYGGCSFEAVARGDLDGDGLFSIYQIAGTIDENGATLEPLYVYLGDE